jgi:hypothetical protein
MTHAPFGIVARALACARLGNGRGRPWVGFVVGSLLAAVAPPALGAPTIAVDSARFGNVFEVGEPPVLTITVSADAEAGFFGTLRIDAVDAYRKSAGRSATTVDLAPGATMTVEFPIRSARLGMFTVRTRLLDAAGPPVLHPTTTAAIVPPIGASAAEESAVGYFTLPHDSELPRARQIAAEMRRLGIRWVRITFDWWMDDREARPDFRDPAWLDSSSFERWVDAFQANGIEVLGTMLGTPRWASSAPDDVEPRGGIPGWARVMPHDLSDRDVCIRTLAERVRGRVRSWEIWNEPDIELFWLSTPEDFVRLTRATAAALHAVDPANRTVLNLVERESPEGLAFYDTVLRGAADVLDVFGLHYGREDWQVTLAARPLLRPPGAVWNTEAYGAPRRHISWWLAQRAAGVERIFPFIYHTVYDDSQLGWDGFGLYPVNVDYTPRPDAIALRTLSDLVGSAAPVGVEYPGGTYGAYTFAGPAGTVVALTDRYEGGPTWSGYPGDWLWLEVPPEVQRVTVVDLMGNRQVLRVRNGRLRLRLLGVAAFLLPEPGDSLAGLRVLRSRPARR